MTLDEMIANGMAPNTEVEIPLTLEQIDLLKSLFHKKSLSLAGWS